jgi:hypothetical protein
MSSFEQTPISHRQFVNYIDKSREYYAAHGYERPYRWARNGDVAFVQPMKDLASSRVAIVTTSHPWNDEHPRGAPAGRKNAIAADASVQPDRMFTADLSWDKKATTTDDVGAFLPISHLQVLNSDGVIGSVSPRYYSIPTEYSQRRTRETDGPSVARWCAEDAVDIVLLVPL